MKFIQPKTAECFGGPVDGANAYIGTMEIGDPFIHTSECFMAYSSDPIPMIEIVAIYILTEPNRLEFKGFRRGADYR